MKNKYLEKIAAGKFMKNLIRELKDTSSLERVGLGMGISGTSMSAANFRLSRQRDARDVEKKNIEAQSLQALRGIHRELKKT